MSLYFFQISLAGNLPRRLGWIMIHMQESPGTGLIYINSELYSASEKKMWTHYKWNKVVTFLKIQSWPGMQREQFFFSYAQFFQPIYDAWAWVACNRASMHWNIYAVFRW